MNEKLNLMHLLKSEHKFFYIVPESIPSDTNFHKMVAA